MWRGGELVAHGTLVGISCFSFRRPSQTCSTFKKKFCITKKRRCDAEFYVAKRGRMSSSHFNDLSPGPSQDPVAGPSTRTSPLRDPASPSSNQAGSSASPPPDDDDNLFLDDHADEADAEWVAKNLISKLRRGNKSKTSGHDEFEYRLACPCCFSLLCLQCQPHDDYEGQFRAVFVRNCKVVSGAAERIVVKGEERGEGKYQAVACRKCNTEVAVLDEEGVYHFCNVLH